MGKQSLTTLERLQSMGASRVPKHKCRPAPKRFAMPVVTNWCFISARSSPAGSAGLPAGPGCPGSVNPRVCDGERSACKKGHGPGDSVFKRAGGLQRPQRVLRLLRLALRERARVLSPPQAEVVLFVLVRLSDASRFGGHGQVVL